MTDARPVLVVDFGAPYTQSIARRVREARIYSEIIARILRCTAAVARFSSGS